MFSCDTRKVLAILKELTVDTDYDKLRVNAVVENQCWYFIIITMENQRVNSENRWLQTT